MALRLLPSGAIGSRMAVSRLAVPFAFVLAFVPAVESRPAWGASKTRIVSLGDPAPGGGVFAGPGFTAYPSAAGAGWIAFRSELDDPSAREAIAVSHVTDPSSRAEVARLGQSAPGWSNAKFKQFLGRPAVNASGDVAFLATTAVKQADGTQETSSGIFLFRSGQLTAVATASASLDPAAPLDAETTQGNFAERTPALNDPGDVAFVAVLPDTGGAAIFLKPVSGELGRVVGTGDAVPGGTLGRVGPPALNDGGMIVFHGAVGDPVQGAAAIFGMSAGGAPALLVGTPLPLPDCDPDAQLTEFDDGLALDANGTVAFTGGPLGTPSGRPGCPLGDPSFGVIVRTPDGTVTPIACPASKLATGEVASGAILPPAGGSAIAVPSITPDGTVVFFTSINEGAAGAILRASPGHYSQPDVLLHLGGAHPDATPAQGTYSAAASPPAVDASGGFAFLARAVGGSTSEGLFYQPAAGPATAVAVGGQGTPEKGFFAGASFGPPHLSDGGDVVFRAFVEQSDSSIGIFRAHGGTIDAIARAGDRPFGDGSPFLNFLGEPSVNGAGTIVFSAVVQDHGRGIFLADAGGLHPIAVRGDPAPDPPGATFLSFGASPAIDEAGSVAFRGTVRFTDPSTQKAVSEDAMFLVDGGRLQKLIGTRQSAPPPAGKPFCSLGDPALSGAPSVAFRATFGEDPVADSGVFLADPVDVIAVALADQSVAGSTFTSFSGTPTADGGGDVAFLAKLAQAGTNTGPAILERAGGVLQQLIASGLAGPAGGSVKTVGAPAMSNSGHVAFHASFVPGTGGTAGYFIAGDQGVALVLAAEEFAPGKGRLSSFGARASLNDQDQLAVIGNVTGGNAANGIFVASPTVLTARALRVQLAGRRKARIALRLKLVPGSTTDGFAPATDEVGVALADTAGPLWSLTVGAGKLKRRGRSFVAGSKKSHTLELVIAGHAAHVAVTSTPLKLKRTVDSGLMPPLTITLNVGDDGGTITVPCHLGGDRRRCIWPAR